MAESLQIIGNCDSVPLFPCTSDNFGTSQEMKETRDEKLASLLNLLDDYVMYQNKVQKQFSREYLNFQFNLVYTRFPSNLATSFSTQPRLLALSMAANEEISAADNNLESYPQLQLIKYYKETIEHPLVMFELW